MIVLYGHSNLNHSLYKKLQGQDRPTLWVDGPNSLKKISHINESSIIFAASRQLDRQPSQLFDLYSLIRKRSTLRWVYASSAILNFDFGQIEDPRLKGYWNEKMKVENLLLRSDLGIYVWRLGKVLLDIEYKKDIVQRLFALRSEESENLNLNWSFQAPLLSVDDIAQALLHFDERSELGVKTLHHEASVWTHLVFKGWLEQFNLEHKLDVSGCQFFSDESCAAVKKNLQEGIQKLQTSYQFLYN
jgi:hypothetical protein